MGLDDFGAASTEVRDYVEAFKSKDTEPHIWSAVYGIYDSRSGDCLYIGEAKWLISRLNDHYNTRTGSQIKAFVESDDEVDIDASNVWVRTEIKYVSGIEGGQKGRKRIESTLIQELDPRYNTR
ncbi:hypothetical protein [Halohasta litorea]|uniref:GIY-YIG domain-containing protein n=1 Tax=Halohasta litorea TaxID=869891 RepID=A0ABD6D9S9_9EURY|nr:hypothetical protein [Halohasta litorea]